MDLKKDASFIWAGSVVENHEPDKLHNMLPGNINLTRNLFLASEII